MKEESTGKFLLNLFKELTFPLTENKIAPLPRDGAEQHDHCIYRNNMKLVLCYVEVNQYFELEHFHSFEYSSKEEAVNDLTELIKEADEWHSATGRYQNSYFMFCGKQFSCLDFTYVEPETDELKYLDPMFKVLTLEEWFEENRID